MRHVERGIDTERRLIHRAQAHLSTLDPDVCESAGMTRIEILVGSEKVVLPLGRKHRKASVIMMAVALNMIDSEERHHRKILLHRQRTEVAQVLACQYTRP